MILGRRFRVANVDFVQFLNKICANSWFFACFFGIDLLLGFESPSPKNRSKSSTGLKKNLKIFRVQFREMPNLKISNYFRKFLTYIIQNSNSINVFTSKIKFFSDQILDFLSQVFATRPSRKRSRGCGANHMEFAKIWTICFQ